MSANTPVLRARCDRSVRQVHQYVGRGFSPVACALRIACTLLIVALCATTARAQTDPQGGASAPQPASAPDSPDLAEARSLFEALDYEHAVPLLDRAILQLEASPSADDKAGRIDAYEMRARARFGLGDRDGTASDLKSILLLDPTFEFGAQVSPRIVAVLDDVRKTVIGTLELSIDPADAQISINGAPLAPGITSVPLVAAEYTLVAERIGFSGARQSVVIVPGETAKVALGLTRTSAVVFLTTTPAGIEVAVDGASRGRTTAATPDASGGSLVLADIAEGPHVLRFSRPCYATEERRVTVTGLADYRLDAIQLAHAVATLSVDSMPSGAQLFVDGEAKGTAPATLADVCEGTRTIELRGPQGRYSTTVSATPGAQLEVHGVLKPAFAVLPASAGLGPDLAASVARALSQSQRVTLVVAGGSEAAAAAQIKTPPDWLSFDAARRPVGGAASVSAAVRRDVSSRVAGALGVQGVASVTQPDPGASDVVVALLAAGASEPDILTFVPDRVDSAARAAARLDRVPRLTRPTIGALAMEVSDAPGVVIGRVEAGGPAARAGLKVGDLITAADGKPVTTPGAFAAAIREKKNADVLRVDVQSLDGSTRSANIEVVEAPQLVSVADRTLPFNALALVWRTRLAQVPEAEQPFVRLNLGIALMHIGDSAGAREQFEAVVLPDGPGIAKGTQQYLLGLALEGVGDAAGARRAWQAAAASDGWLTADGPPVRELATRKLGTGAATSSLR